MADAYFFKEAPIKYELKLTNDKDVIKVSFWLPSYHRNEVCGLPIVPRKLHTEYKLNRTSDKGAIKVSLWLPWQLSYHSNEVVG